VVEDDEVVAVSGGEVEVVECDDAGDVERTQQFEQVELVADVEVVGWLVEQDLSWLLSQGAGQLGALFLAAGERVPALVLFVGDVDSLECGVDDPLIGVGECVEPATEGSAASSTT
jgi:hypothetical protein